MPNALDIFNRSEDLRTIYLLRHAPGGSSMAPTEAEAGLFLLWMAAFGRKLYQGIVIDPDLFDYITGPVGEYLTRMELFADKMRGPSMSGDRPHMSKVHRWYYLHGIRELNLEFFVTPRELAALDRMRPSLERAKAGMTLLDEILWNIDAEPGSPLDPYGGTRTGTRASTNREAVGPPPWLTKPADAPDRRSGGVNLIGYANNVLGLGEDVRSAARALVRAGVPFSILNVALPEAVTASEANDLSGFFVDRPIFRSMCFVWRCSRPSGCALKAGPTCSAGATTSAIGRGSCRQCRRFGTTPLIVSTRSGPSAPTS